MNSINTTLLPYRTVTQVDGIYEPYTHVRTTLPEEHYIRKKYGIEERSTYIFADSGYHASLSGKTFGDRHFEFAVSNRTGRNIHSDIKQYFTWLKLTQDMSVPDFVVKGVNHLESKEAYNNIAGDNIEEEKRPNLSIRKGHQCNEYEDLMFVDTRVSPEHKLYKKYGIERLLVFDNTETGERRLVLEGKTFNGRQFHESISKYTGETIKAVLNRLERTRDMNISDAVVNIGRHLTGIKG